MRQKARIMKKKRSAVVWRDVQLLLIGVVVLAMALLKGLPTTGCRADGGRSRLQPHLWLLIYAGFTLDDTVALPAAGLSIATAGSR